jgi:hypothetical protein
MVHVSSHAFSLRRTLDRMALTVELFSVMPAE